MSIIKDTFFGGAEKKAAKAQTKALGQSQDFIREGVEKGKKEALPLYNSAMNNLLAGFQGGLDVFGQAIPAQQQIFQQGNVAAQEQLLAGLPQMNNAILGGPIDYSQLQATQLQTPNLDFLNQQLPAYSNPYQPNNADMGASMLPNGQYTGPLSGAPSGNVIGTGMQSNYLSGMPGRVIKRIF